MSNLLFFHSRSRVRTEREERKIEGDLRRSQRACEQLDSQKVKGFMARLYITGIIHSISILLKVKNKIVPLKIIRH